MGLRGVLTIVAVLLAATACAGSNDPAPVNASCSEQTAPPAGSTPGQTPMLFKLLTTPNGWMPKTGVQPDLVIYADGQAVTSDAAGYVPKCVIDDAIADTAALTDTDFGEPTVSDQGSRSIDYTHDPAVHLKIYAPGFTEGLTQEQIEARGRFAAVHDHLMRGFVKTGALHP